MAISFDVGPEQALQVLEHSLKKRDTELESLREQLEALRRQLDLTSAERDHLRSGIDRRSSRGEIVVAAASDGSQKVSRPDFAALPGQSKVKLVEDSRIGKPRKILVIGGGPAGLISLHELLNPVNRPDGTKLDDVEIQLYERRAEIGGVWYFEPENDIAKGWHDGSSGWQAAEEDPKAAEVETGDGKNPYPGIAGDMESLDWMRDTLVNGYKNSTVNEIEKAPRQGSVTSADFCYYSKPQNAPRWPSPAYEGLVGNVLPPIVEFAARPINKPAGGLFPSMVETHQYLLDLAEPLRPYIKTCQEVIEVVPKFHAYSSRVSWVVTKIDWSEEGQGEESTEEFDAIITAAGAFDHPYWPDTPGLAKLRKQRSPLIMHAKAYPGPRPFVNQNNRFVVVGNANSANDIAAHLAPLNSSGPLYRCIRHPSNFAHLKDPRIVDVPPIANVETSQDHRSLNITLEDGTKLDGITKLIFASGYQYTFPWLSVPSISPKNASTAPQDAALEPASKYGAVPNLHNATWLAAAPTLAFIGLSAGSTPMPLAEIQARAVARTWNNLLALPPTREELLADYAERAALLGLKDEDPENWRALHMVRGPPERKLTAALLDELEASEKGCSDGLFRWDEWREEIIKGMRAVKEGELRRLRNAKVAAGGVDGGVGGVLSYGPVVGQRFTPVFGDKKGRGKSLAL